VRTPKCEIGELISWSGRCKYQNGRINSHDCSFFLRRNSHDCSSPNNSEAIENWISLRLFNNFACRFVPCSFEEVRQSGMIAAFDLWTGLVVAVPVRPA
jgi:hypothetical protein